jgi:2,3-dihydroxyphenylpropionate 1,2-dioxygenase
MARAEGSLSPQWGRGQGEGDKHSPPEGVVEPDVIAVGQIEPRYAWGRALREILEARPERVALMASGGMSHYPGTDRYASPDFDWDRSLLGALSEGRGAETARLTGEELDKAGNVELRTWITLLGAVGKARAQVICYEPSWHHGNAMVTWPVAPSGARS